MKTRYNRNYRHSSPKFIKKSLTVQNRIKERGPATRSSQSQSRHFCRNDASFDETTRALRAQASFSGRTSKVRGCFSAGCSRVR